jgi:hypothetical protein
VPIGKQRKCSDEANLALLEVNTSRSLTEPTRWIFECIQGIGSWSLRLFKSNQYNNGSGRHIYDCCSSKPNSEKSRGTPFQLLDLVEWMESYRGATARSHRSLRPCEEDWQADLVVGLRTIVLGIVHRCDLHLAWAQLRIGNRSAIFRVVPSALGARRGAYRKPMPELSVRKIIFGEACGTISPTTLAFQKNTHIKRPTETIPLRIIATVLDTFSIPRELFFHKLV